MIESSKLTALTAGIAAEFVAKNRVSHHDVGALIAAIYSSLSALGEPAAKQAVAEFVPSVTIRKSLADPAKIISMIDGKPYSILKRHLLTHGLTPDEYRARYNLPADYPMTAPAYSERRKALALKIGLGRKNNGRPSPRIVTTSGDAAVPKKKAPRTNRTLSGKAASAKVR